MPACLTFNIHENLYMHEKREPICTPIYPHRSTASRRSRLASRSTRHLGAPRCCRIDVHAGNTDRNIVDSWVSSAARLGRYTVPPSAMLGPNIKLIYLSINQDWSSHWGAPQAPTKANCLCRYTRSNPKPDPNPNPRPKTKT